MAKDGVGGGDVDSFIDTEPYSFNIDISSHGNAGNRITAVAGEAQQGETFFKISVNKSFRDEPIAVYQS